MGHLLGNESIHAILDPLAQNCDQHQPAFKELRFDGPLHGSAAPDQSGIADALTRRLPADRSRLLPPWRKGEGGDARGYLLGLVFVLAPARSSTDRQLKRSSTDRCLPLTWSRNPTTLPPTNRRGQRQPPTARWELPADRPP